MAIVLVKSADGEYRAITGGPEDRHIPKAAGFRFSGDRTHDGKRFWFTRDVAQAEKLARYASPDLAAQLDGAGAKARAAAEAAIAASRATDADIAIPAPEGLAYLPYQKAGINYALQAFHAGKPGVLIGDQPGLGKTIQVIGIFNADPSIKRALIIPPASLRLNWRKEFLKWTVRPVTVEIAQTGAPLPESDVVICNYDVLDRFKPEIDARAWDLVCCDESHYLKNPKAARTCYVLGGTLPPTKEEKAAAKREFRQPKGEKVPAIPARRFLALSGTPILNRPIELWPVVQKLDPAGLGANWVRFAFRYCGAEKGRFGTKFPKTCEGMPFLNELQNELRQRFLVRRLKEDVLKELPPKRRQVIEIAANGAKSAVERERAAHEAVIEAKANAEADMALAVAAGDDKAYRRAVERLQKANAIAFEDFAKLRRQTAEAKIPYVIAHLRDATEGGAKVVCFAHHKTVIAALKEEFGDAAVTLTGETPNTEKQAAVDRFQTDPDCTLFLGNIRAAGVGHTLTASSHVVFAELPPTPGEATQAEDRCHRISQRNMVLVQHLIFEGSVDVNLARMIVDKQEIADRALDTGAGDAGLVDLTPLDLDAMEAEAAARAADREAWARDRDAARAERKARAAERAAREKESAEEGWKRRQKEYLDAKSRDDAEAAAMTAKQIAAVHEALRFLAGACDGAFQRDGAGFNKPDSKVGATLAALPELTGRYAVLGRRTVRKYAGQYGADLLARMG